MDNAVRTRQRFLAVCLPVTAARYIAAEGSDPKGTNQIITTTATARHSIQLYVSGSLSELSLGAVVISYVAISILVRERGATGATVAALTGGVGALCGAIVNVFAGRPPLQRRRT